MAKGDKLEEVGEAFGERQLVSLERATMEGTRSGYDEAVGRRICNRMATGEPLSVACEEEGVAWTVVNRWLDWGGTLREALKVHDANLLPNYVRNFLSRRADMAWDLVRFVDAHDRARAHFYDYLAEECITLADSVVEYKQRQDSDRSHGRALKQKDLSSYTAAVKLQIQTRQWYIERRASDKYGDVQRVAPKHQLVTPVLNITANAVNANNNSNPSAAPTTHNIEYVEATLIEQPQALPVPALNQQPAATSNNNNPKKQGGK